MSGGSSHSFSYRQLKSSSTQLSHQWFNKLLVFYKPLKQTNSNQTASATNQFNININMQLKRWQTSQRYSNLFWIEFFFTMSVVCIKVVKIVPEYKRLWKVYFHTRLFKDSWALVSRLVCCLLFPFFACIPSTVCDSGSHIKTTICHSGMAIKS